MVRTKVTPRKGEGKSSKEVKKWAQFHADQASPAPSDPPVPELEQAAPTQNELEKRVEEAEKLAAVGS